MFQMNALFASDASLEVTYNKDLIFYKTFLYKY